MIVIADNDILKKRACCNVIEEFRISCDVELKDVSRQLTEEETEISYRRRILHGKIDILRAELVNRLRHRHEDGEITITGEDVQKLTDILAQRQPQDAE